MVRLEKAVTVVPPYTKRMLRCADAALGYNRNAYTYQFKCGE